MDYAFVSVPVAPVRLKARHQSELTNQFLFGEPVKLLKTKGRLWGKVRSMQDQHEGWVTLNQLQEADAHEVKLYSLHITGELFTPIVIEGRSMLIPFGSSLPGFDIGAGKIGPIGYSMAGDPLLRNKQSSLGEVIANLTIPWINAPYLWGGKTILGVDCSGFVQVIFKALGIDLPRDAWQQAQEGETVNKFRDAEPGDLMFFDDKDEIVHVGIYLGNEKLIHASGRVRVDGMDKKGIVHASTGERTHALRVVKRLS